MDINRGADAENSATAGQRQDEGNNYAFFQHISSETGA
jgi:hypothetical protein